MDQMGTSKPLTALLSVLLQIVEKDSSPFGESNKHTIRLTSNFNMGILKSMHRYFQAMVLIAGVPGKNAIPNSLAEARTLH